MAYDHKRLGGNINSSSEQSTMYIYASDVDTLATIAAVDYFKEANGTPVATTPGHGDNILFKDDIIKISGLDGFAVGKVDATGATVVLVLSEV